MKEEEKIELLARIAHEANRAYCLSLGDLSQAPWDEAPDWQKQSAIAGVKGALAGNTPEESHKSWVAHKLADGWVYGPVKDPEKKTHPCMVSYEYLPPDQLKKDAIFTLVIRAVAGALDGMSMFRVRLEGGGLLIVQSPPVPMTRAQLDQCAMELRLLADTFEHAEA